MRRDGAKRVGLVELVAALSAIIGLWTAADVVRAAGAKQGVDVRASRVYVFVDKTGLGHEHGVEGRLKAGTISLGKTADAGELSFDMTSFRADTPAARKYVGLSGTTSASTRKQVDANMLGEKVLDVAHYPTATFHIDSARMIGKKSRRGYPIAELKGRFSLHGVTRRVSMLTELIEKDGRVRIRGGFRIRQSDYGIKPFTKAFGAIGVADELRIYGEIVLAGRPAASTARQPSGAEGTR